MITVCWERRKSDKEVATCKERLRDSDFSEEPLPRNLDGCLVVWVSCTNNYCPLSNPNPVWFMMAVRS